MLLAYGERLRLAAEGPAEARDLRVRARRQGRPRLEADAVFEDERGVDGFGAPVGWSGPARLVARGSAAQTPRKPGHDQVLRAPGPQVVASKAPAGKLGADAREGVHDLGRDHAHPQLGRCARAPRGPRRGARRAPGMDGLEAAVAAAR